MPLEDGYLLNYSFIVALIVPRLLNENGDEMETNSSLIHTAHFNNSHTLDPHRKAPCTVTKP